MRKLLTTIVLMLSLAASTFAVEVEIDGLWYDLASEAKVATVLRYKNSAYCGVIVIPENVVHEGNTYSVTSIGAEAFSYCYDLTSVTIPNSVTSIGEKVFYNCWSLTSITIPSSVTSIGNSAFYNCSGLTSVTIPNSVTSIGGAAFYGCSGLTSVTIPNSVTSIGDNAFYNCSGLTSVTIGSSVTSIGFSAFRYCSGLTSVTIPNSVTRIENYAFECCSRLTSVTIGSSVTGIGSYAFLECKKLTSVTIPNSVMSIGNYAFADCFGLTSVTIGSGVTSMGNNAFDGVDIPTVISLIENPFEIIGKTSDYRTFSQNTFNNATLYVPKGTIDKYKATDGWKDFVFIEEGTGGGDTPTTPKCEKPTISYENGKLSFTSETEGAEFISEITDADIKTYYDSWIQLSAAYNISVYATKSGYDNSDVVTATLYFTSASLNDPSGISSAKASAPVLIQTLGNTLHVTGVEDGTEVVVFGLDGSYIGHSKSFGGTVNIELNGANQIVIVKVGNESVKVKI